MNGTFDCLIVGLNYRWVGVAHKGVKDSVKTMSLRLSEESQLTKSAYEFSKSRKDPAFQSWINKGGPGLSSQSQHIKPDKKLPPHPDFALKGTEPVKRVRCILFSIVLTDCFKLVTITDLSLLCYW